MQTVQIPIANAADGSLIPHPQGQGLATVTFNYDMNGKTAIINFMGNNQALITFDETGNQPVSYMPYSPMATQQDLASIENIMRYIPQLFH